MSYTSLTSINILDNFQIVKNGLGEITYYNNPKYVSYYGNLKDDKIHGKGKLVFLNGNIFVGTFNMGSWSGRGYYICSCCNQTFDGCWTPYDNKISYGIPHSTSTLKTEE